MKACNQINNKRAKLYFTLCNLICKKYKSLIQKRGIFN